MTFLSKLFGGGTVAPVQQVAVPTLVLFKRKKWVVYKGALGIVKEILPPEMCVVALVSPVTGHTVEEIQVPINECRIAQWAELKDMMEVRNKEPFTKEAAAALGYF